MIRGTIKQAHALWNDAVTTYVCRPGPQHILTSESLKKTNVSAHSQNNEIMIDMQRLEVGDR